MPECCLTFSARRSVPTTRPTRPGAIRLRREGDGRCDCRKFGRLIPARLLFDGVLSALVDAWATIRPALPWDLEHGPGHRISIAMAPRAPASVQHRLPAEGLRPHLRS
jgi:hypothetical protein